VYLGVVGSGSMGEREVRGKLKWAWM